MRDARPFESTKFPVSIALTVLVEQPTNLEIARFAAERRFAKEQTRAADLMAHQSSSKKLAGERGRIKTKGKLATWVIYASDGLDLRRVISAATFDQTRRLALARSVRAHKRLSQARRQ